MLRNSLAAIAALVACISCGPAAPPVATVPWRVVESIGLVQVQTAETPARAAAAEDVLPPGAVVTTGAESSATLGNGLQLMTMSANSRLAIPEKQRAGMTNVLQGMGSILFQVDHRETPHFRVETPLLAAIVKGTTFRVDISSSATTVAVTEGLVEVRANDGEAHEDVPKGYAARVEADVPETVVLMDREEVRRWTAAAASPAPTPAGSGGAAMLRGKLNSADVELASATSGDGGSGRFPVAHTSHSGGKAHSEQAASHSAERGKSKPKWFWESGSGGQGEGVEVDGQAWVVVGYVAVTLVGWVVLVFAVLFGRAVLRDMKEKEKSTKKQRKAR